MVFGACFLKAREAPWSPIRAITQPGADLHSWIRALLLHGTAVLPTAWNWSPDDCQMLYAHLTCLVAPAPFSPQQLPSAAGLHVVNSAVWSSPARPYPAAMCAFLHGLRAGLPWASSLDGLARLPLGHFSADGRVFCIPSAARPGGYPDSCVPLCDPADSEALTLFFSGTELVAVCSSHSVLPRPTLGPADGVRLLSSGQASRFLPEYVRLKKTPARDVMSVYSARAEWHRRLGPLDTVAAAVVEGRMVMPKPRLPLRHSRRPNHASWERNEAAKIALGPKFAVWVWQGVVEVVPRGCSLPLFIEPLGAVDKATAPWWRLILDARISNEFQDPWGVWYFSVSQLAALLDYCDIMFAEDLEDAYHLSIFAGCTGKPFWSCVFTIDEHGAVVRRWRLVMGCDPSTCLGLCDKAMSGFCIDGVVCRFAAAHFGQRNAGSPLNALMRAIQRFLARRAPRPLPPPPVRSPPAQPVQCVASAGCPFPLPPAQVPPTQPLLCDASAWSSPSLPPPSSRPFRTRRAPPDPAPGDPTLGPSPPSTRRGLHPEAIHSVVWVDDTVYITKTPPHPSCAGLLGGCPICRRTTRTASRSQHYWHNLAAALGLGLSDDKRQLPSQRVVYTGMVVDSYRGTISIPPEKKARLAECLEDFFFRREATLSELASLRGRIQHYSAGLPYVLPFVALLTSIIGTDGQPVYDSSVFLPPVVSEAAVFIRGVLEDYAESGRPLWPPVASSLFDSFMAGHTGAARVVIITWDSSVHGWGLVLRWWANPAGKVIVGSLPDTDDMQHQVRREALGGVLAFAAAAKEVDLSDAWVIMRNDAVGALSALRKGCASSTFLQQCSMRLAMLHREARCHPLFLHAPGDLLILEGVDGLSREVASEVSGPTSSPLVRDRATQLARALGWELTVDAFASESNTLLPRFFARYAEPQAEAEDAFAVGDWDRSTCPFCGRCHREVLFAFPPTRLLNRFVAKARADGVRAILVTPLAVSAPYWPKLLRASVVPNADGYLRIRRQAAAPPDSDAAGELAIFAVDFSPWSTRRLVDESSPPCGMETLFRGRDPRGSATDLADRQRILEQMVHLGLALR